jgi:hypothetical protein
MRAERRGSYADREDAASMATTGSFGTNDADQVEGPFEVPDDRRLRKRQAELAVRDAMYAHVAMCLEMASALVRQRFPDATAITVSLADCVAAPSHHRKSEGVLLRQVLLPSEVVEVDACVEDDRISDDLVAEIEDELTEAFDYRRGYVDLDNLGWKDMGARSEAGRRRVALTTTKPTASARRYVASVQWEGDSSPLGVARELEQLVLDGPVVEVRDTQTGDVCHIDLATDTVTQQ